MLRKYLSACRSMAMILRAAWTAPGSMTRLNRRAMNGRRTVRVGYVGPWLTKTRGTVAVQRRAAHAWSSLFAIIIELFGGGRRVNLRSARANPISPLTRGATGTTSKAGPDAGEPTPRNSTVCPAFARYPASPEENAMIPLGRGLSGLPETGIRTRRLLPPELAVQG